MRRFYLNSMPPPGRRNWKRGAGPWTCERAFLKFSSAQAGVMTAPFPGRIFKSSWLMAPMRGGWSLTGRRRIYWWWISPYYHNIETLGLARHWCRKFAARPPQSKNLFACSYPMAIAPGDGMKDSVLSPLSKQKSMSTWNGGRLFQPCQCLRAGFHDAA